MYSHVLPLMFPVAALNFFMMYWIDKTLLLRFYKIPKNYDGASIEFTLSMSKYAFLFHALLGFFALSNNSILTSDNTVF